MRKVIQITISKTGRHSLWEKLKVYSFKTKGRLSFAEKVFSPVLMRSIFANEDFKSDQLGLVDAGTVCAVLIGQGRTGPLVEWSYGTSGTGTLPSPLLGVTQNMIVENKWFN